MSVASPQAAAGSLIGNALDEVRHVLVPHEGGQRLNRDQIELFEVSPRAVSDSTIWSMPSSRRCRLRTMTGACGGSGERLAPSGNYFEKCSCGGLTTRYEGSPEVDEALRAANNLRREID
jgi:hypothetical protein